MSGTGKINDCFPIGTSLVREVTVGRILSETSKKDEQIARLQEQLNEVNEVIKKHKRFEVALKVEKGTLTGVYPAVDYLKKWGVK